MNVILCTDSASQYNRLASVLSGIPDIKVIKVVNDLNAAETSIRQDAVHILITSIQNVNDSDFKKMTEIKTNNIDLVVIALNNNSSARHFNQWKNSGVDYVLDQPMHFGKIVDILSGLIYKNLLAALKSEKNGKV